jgi:hypothetical protein
MTSDGVWEEPPYGVGDGVAVSIRVGVAVTGFFTGDGVGLAIYPITPRIKRIQKRTTPAIRTFLSADIPCVACGGCGGITGCG